MRFTVRYLTRWENRSRRLQTWRRRRRRIAQRLETDYFSSEVSHRGLPGFGSLSILAFTEARETILVPPTFHESKYPLFTSCATLAVLTPIMRDAPSPHDSTLPPYALCIRETAAVSTAPRTQSAANTANVKKKPEQNWSGRPSM